MAIKRIKDIKDIKSLEDLNHLKMKKKYEIELKKLEFQSSVIRLQMNLSPDHIKETIVNEGQSYLKSMAMEFLPSFFLKFFRK